MSIVLFVFGSTDFKKESVYLRKQSVYLRKQSVYLPRCVVEPELLKDFNVGLTTLNDSLHQMQNYILCAHNTQTISASGSVTLRCLRPLVARKVAIFNSGPKMTICEVVVIGYLYSGKFLS